MSTAARVLMSLEGTLSTNVEVLGECLHGLARGTTREVQIRGLRAGPCSCVHVIVTRSARHRVLGTEMQ